MTNTGTAAWQARRVSADLDALAREVARRKGFQTVGDFIEFSVRSQLTRMLLVEELAERRAAAAKRERAA